MIHKTGIELLRLPILVAEVNTQEMLINNFELNFEAQKIRNIDAYITHLDYEVIGNKLVMQGLIHKQIFYVTIDDVVQHQSEELDFSIFIDVPGAAPQMDVDIQITIESIKSELLIDGTLLHQKVLLDISVFIEEEQQLFVETGTGPLFLVDRVIGENDAQTMLESALELDIPAIKVSDIRAQLTEIEAEAINNKVFIQGVLHKQIYFIGTDNVEHHQEENIPVSQFIDLPGVRPGMDVQVSAQVEYIKRSLDAEGLILEQKVVINYRALASEEAQLRIQLDTNGKEVRLNKVLNEDVGQILQEDSLLLDLPAIKIKEIGASLEEIQTQILTDKVVIQGILHKQIYFIGEDNVEYHQELEVPFNGFIDLPGVSAQNSNIVVDTKIEYIKPILDQGGEELTQKTVIEFFVKAFQDPAVKYRISISELSFKEEC